MESLALPSLNALTVLPLSFHKEQSTKLLGKARHFKSVKPSSLKLTPSVRTHHPVWIIFHFSVLINEFYSFNFFIFSFLFIDIFLGLPCLGAEKMKGFCLCCLEFRLCPNANWWGRLRIEADEGHGCCKEEMGYYGISQNFMSLH